MTTRTIAIVVITTYLLQPALADWKKYTLDNGAEHRELIVDSHKLYHYSTIITKKGTERRVTNHQFFWKGILVLTLQEHDNMDEVYLGNNSTMNPEAGVPAHTWDYNKDGVIDAVTIGPSKDGKEYFFGRYQDGVFGWLQQTGHSPRCGNTYVKTIAKQPALTKPLSRAM